MLERQSWLGRDARIAVGIDGSAEAARTIVVVACSATAVPLDPKLTVAEVERCLLILRPSAVTVVLRGVDLQPPARRRPPWHSGYRQRPAQPGKLIYSSPLHHRRSGSAGQPDPDDSRPLFFTRQAPPSHRIWSPLVTAMRSLPAKRIQTWFALTPHDRCLNVSPIYYSRDPLTTTVFHRCSRAAVSLFSRQSTECGYFRVVWRARTHLVFGRPHTASGRRRESPIAPRWAD